MAAKKKAAVTSTDAPAPDRRTGNLGPITDAPINPAMDPSKTAEERLAALTEQHKEMQRRADLGLPPD
jgi:hypothetical protein